MPSDAANNVRMLDVDQERALGAAGMGAWDWDIPADRLHWSQAAALVFGRDAPFTESHEEFLQRVDDADRDRVDASIARAFDGTSRAVVEFRVRHPAGGVRWLRCCGRVTTVGTRAVSMSGLIDDITDQRTPSRRPAPARPAGTFSSTQVAQILGIAEASVKRLADAGTIQCQRATARGRRAFSAQQVIDYLRASRRAGAYDLAQAVRALDMKEAVAQVLDELGRGRKLEDLLDSVLLPNAFGAPSGFTADLLKRLSALAARAETRGPPVLLARVGDATLETRMVECVLRAAGFEVLSASENVGPADLAEMAGRVGAAFAVFVLGKEPSDGARGALAAAAALADELGQGRVCVHASGDLEVPPGVARVRTLSELGLALRAA